MEKHYRVDTTVEITNNEQIRFLENEILWILYRSSIQTHIQCKHSEANSSVPENNNQNLHEVH